MDLLTVEEVAKLLKAHTNTVYKMCRQGRLPSVKMGKEWRIDKQKLMEFMEAGSHLSQESTDNKKTIQGFKPSHTLILTRDREDVWDYEVDFFKKNSGKGYLLYKGCWWQKPEQVREVYTKKGFDIYGLEACGDIVVDDLEEISNNNGPIAAADAWRSRAHWAIENGFKGMIGCGSPIMSGNKSRKDFFTFEEALDGFLDGLPVQGICAYFLEGRKSLDWESVIRLMKHHGQVIFRGKNADVLAEIIEVSRG